MKVKEPVLRIVFFSGNNEIGQYLLYRELSREFVRVLALKRATGQRRPNGDVTIARETHVTPPRLYDNKRFNNNALGALTAILMLARAKMLKFTFRERRNKYY